MPGIITHSNSSMSRQALRQQAEKHRLVRLFRGAYMDAQEYAALDISGRYRARAQAFLATHAKLRAWGITAAALEGAPVLGGAPLHFGGARSHAKSKQDGCAFHEASLETPSNPVAQTLFECASTSPLPDALLAANYLLRRSSAKAQGGLVACRDIDESTTEALVWEPATSGSGEASSRSAFDIRMLDMEEPEFLSSYSAARVTGFVSPESRASVARLRAALLRQWRKTQNTQRVEGGAVLYRPGRIAGRVVADRPLRRTWLRNSLSAGQHSRPFEWEASWSRRRALAL